MWSEPHTRPRAVVGGVLVLAVIGVAVGVWWVMRPGAGVPASAPSPGRDGYAVEIDGFSGRENPVLSLDADVGQELWWLVEDQTLAGGAAPVDAPSNPADPAPSNPADPSVEADPQAGLGFRGFLVTSPRAEDPPLRVRPDTVHVMAPDGTRRLDHTIGYYNRIYDAVRDRLDPDLLAALPPTDPPYPDVRAEVPPSTGSPASWELADPSAVHPGATEIDVLVTRAECSNGVTGEVLEPAIGWGDGQVILRTDVAPLDSMDASCPGNDAVPLQVELGRPIGEREILDAHCLAPPGLRTSTCANGAVRWAP